MESKLRLHLARRRWCASLHETNLAQLEVYIFFFFWELQSLLGLLNGNLTVERGASRQSAVRKRFLGAPPQGGYLRHGAI